jgi:hypothetical protein
VSEAKQITVGVLSGVSGIALLFIITMMIARQGDEPVTSAQSVAAQVPAKPAITSTVPLAHSVTEQPKPLLAEQPLPGPANVQASPTAVNEQPQQEAAIRDASALSNQLMQQMIANQAGSATSVPVSSPPQPVAQTDPKESDPLPDVPAAATSTRTRTRAAASAPAVVDQSPAPTGGTPYDTTATGIPTYVGPRGGVYHYSRSGKKVYERRR